MKIASKFIVLFVVLVLTGCAAPQFSFPTPPKNEPTKKYHHNETIKREPVVQDVLLPSGEKAKIIVGEKVEQTFSAGLEAVEPKPSLFARLWGLFGPWLILLIALNLLGIFFPPVAAIMGLVNRGLGAGTKRIVTGMELVFNKLEATKDKTYTGAEVDAMIRQMLGDHYNDETKDLVKKIKAKK